MNGIKDISDKMVERRYARAASSLEQALEYFDKLQKPTEHQRKMETLLRGNMREFAVSVQAKGIAGSDEKLEQLEGTLNLIEIEQDLRIGAKDWSTEEREAMVREMMEGLGGRP